MAKFSIDAQVLRQHGIQMYLFSLDSKTLNSICYVTPRSKDDPDEVQRILNEKRAREIGKYIKQENNVLPNGIVVSLSDEVKINPQANGKNVTLVFPEESGKFAYVLDGQHRLAGFKHSDGIVFDLPVVALYNADLDLRGKIFADINSLQQRVSDVLTLSLYYQIKELPKEESTTMDVVSKLNTISDSPLAGKIKMRDDEVGTWVTNKKMKGVTTPYVGTGGILSGKSPDAQARIIIDYFKAISELWPDAWGNNKSYFLTKPMGIEVMMGTFAAVCRRCDLNEGMKYNAQSFKNQMDTLVGTHIQLPGGGTISLDWRSGSISALSNKVGRSLITKQLSDILVRADSPEEEVD
ncbi:hypothetical protein IX51_05945 [uncultured archaeon]|nr:hypothetical protein IX51_05945 [uncultured archaeon]